MAQVVDATDSSFARDVLQADQPVLVDFWAPHCSACRTIAPIVDGLAAEFAGQLRVVKVNTDQNPNTPTQFGVRAIPNILLFKHGVVQEQIIGAVTKMRLLKAIDQVLA